MSDSTTPQLLTLEQLVLPAEGCEGDACVIPLHHEQRGGVASDDVSR